MNKILTFAAVLTALTMVSCKDYLDINQDPNAITEVGNDFIFPTAEVNLAATMGVGFNINGGYAAEIYSQNAGCSNYLNYSQFQFSATNTTRSYSQLFARVLAQLDVIEKQTKEDETGTLLACATLKAYTFQILVDAYGEIPYSEAFDATNTQPKYDDGKDIYADIIEKLETAKANASAYDNVCNNFLFSSVDKASNTKAEPWIQFANAVLLKLYMRESAVVDVKSKVEALIAEDNFPTTNVGFDKCWSDAKGSWSPLYAEKKEITTSDITPNYALTATVAQCESDTRLYYNYEKGAHGMIGSISGTNLSTEMPGSKTSDFAQPKYRFNQPIWIMTLAEIDLFIAEYYATMASNMTKAEEYYNAAIESNCDLCGCTAVDKVLASYKFDSSNAIQSIGIQKWIILGTVMNGFEAWCEVRRLGYPTFEKDEKSNTFIDYKTPLKDVSEWREVAVDYQIGTLYTPKNVEPKVGVGKLAQRFDYASDSKQYNSNAPATKEPTVPVFWAAK
ncbi:MAG: SusD/RagB family nutrient-binding outer membrane lipoprotein [Salinivirgaceae bacterium]|nr:SusD/RagB family nutrient-binding outer membrane lipoprotein [Salinivirgaceae bacterium]